MPTWDDVLAIGAELPEVTESTWFRTPCLRVRKKSFCRMKEDGETLVVRVVDLEDKEALLRSDPEVFWTTPHYDGYPYVLVRLERIDPAQLRELIEDAWRLSAPRCGLTAGAARAGSRRTPPFHARGSAAHPGPAGWHAPPPRRPASRTPVRSPRHGSSGPPPPSPGP